jgi:hypothetical protein
MSSLADRDLSRHKMADFLARSPRQGIKYGNEADKRRRRGLGEEKGDEGEQ